MNYIFYYKFKAGVSLLEHKYTVQVSITIDKNSSLS